MNKNDNFGHPSGMFWYDDNFAFIPVPKNASSTVSSMLNLRSNVGYANGDMDKLTELNTFAIIRNPYTRIISAYSEILKLRPDGGVATTRQLPFFKVSDPIRKFDQFIRDIREEGFYDAHIQPQSYYIADYPVDNLLRFEHLQEDLTKMLHDNGFSAFNTQNKNVSKLNKNIYMDYINTNRTIGSIIQSLYSDDFKLFDKLADNYE